LCVKGIRKPKRPATARIEDVLAESIVEWDDMKETHPESIYEEQWNSSLKQSLREAA